jgi:DNA-binding response OmpR family regulator
MKHIIITDDDASMRDIFQLILQRAGYIVTCYSDGEILLSNRFELPDLFILDKQLSGVDGLDICRFLKSQESTKNVPIIIISASPYVAQLANEAGADDFIEKPFKTKELLAMAEKYINKAA